MRSKEEAHDYRYFPDPDLPPLVVDDERIGRVRSTMRELPEARRRRFVGQYALTPYHAAQVAQTRDMADYFEAAVTAGAAPQAASNWITGELARLLKEAATDIAASPVTPEHLAGLAKAVDAGTIGGPVAKTVLEKMFSSGRTADAVIAAENLAQIDDEEHLASLIRGVVASNGDAVAQYQRGKTATFGFLVGQVMKAAGGKANPRRVNELLRRALETS
jgi:aspartyl-tRNA(Asn)/glutamyl-tRNA(Gln) amidotransferase subunit B